MTLFIKFNCVALPYALKIKNILIEPISTPSYGHNYCFVVLPNIIF